MNHKSVSAIAAILCGGIHSSLIHAGTRRIAAGRFALAICAVALFCTGCFSHGTWDDLGKTEVILPEYNMRFALTPDGDGIVFSGRQKTAHYCWPLIHCIDNNRGHSKYTWNTYKTVEKRVSLDALTEGHWRQDPRPYRENLVRFYLVVEPDPTAPLSLPEDDMTPYFEALAERVEAGTAPTENTHDADWSRRYVNPGETLRLRIHPDDLQLLSERPNVLLRLPRRMGNGLPELSALLLACPVAQADGRYEMLAYRGEEFYDIFFWKDAMDVGSTGFFGWCWKVLWMPAAVVADIVSLPVYLIQPAVLMNQP